MKDKDYKRLEAFTANARASGMSEPDRLCLSLLRLVVSGHKRQMHQTSTRDYKRSNGLKYCRYPGFGFRWFRGKRVVDEQEMATIAEIAKMRDEGGLSFEKIALDLLRRRVVTRDGREWSPWRCERAYRAVQARQPGAFEATSTTRD